MVNINPPSSSTNTPFVVENPSKKNVIQALWQSQVLIHFSLNDIPHAFLGPFAPKKTTYPILAFHKAINTTLNHTHCQFWSMPSNTSKRSHERSNLLWLVSTIRTQKRCILEEYRSLCHDSTSW
jgi:hypothetical protein